MEAEIRKAISETLSGLDLDEVEFTVEHPTEFSHGDYATNVAMVCAQKAGQSPRGLSEQIQEKLEGKIPHVLKIEIAGPGFINFYLDRDFFTEKITEIQSKGDSWGRNENLKKEKILFEYTSPNLFKPLHIGNLVGNIVGESISRLFEFGGAEVYRLNYPSDIGLTVAKAVWGLIQTNGNSGNIKEIGEAYRVGSEAYESNEKSKEEIIGLNKKLYEGADQKLQELKQEGINTSRTHLAKLCERLGTIFDADIPESEASPYGLEIVKKHTGTIFEKSEGAIVFKGEKFGLHTRVFINSKGLPTYEAKDLGNFALKQDKYPEWTKSYVVTGSEQREYFKVLTAALREVFPEIAEKPIEHIATGFLTLSTGKMSSRKGNVLTGEEILADVSKMAHLKAKESRAEDIDVLSDILAVSAIKYQILRQAIGTDIIFDKERALSLDGDSGPYLEYTHARIYSILNKAKALKLEADTSSAPEEIFEVERLVYQFSEIVERAQNEYAPHHLVTYVTALAGAFNSFYSLEKIVDVEDKYSPYKLALAGAVGQTIKNSLILLGIRVVDRM